MLFRFHGGGPAITVIQRYVGGAFALPLASTFPPSAQELLASIQYPKITKVYMVPLFLEELIPLLRQDNNHGFERMAKFQFVLSTGAACSPDICKEFIEQGVNLVQSVGAAGKQTTVTKLVVTINLLLFYQKLVFFSSVTMT